VQVASRAAVYQKVKPGLIGQVLATQSGLGSLSAVIPTFLAGALLDVLPVTVFLTGLAAVAIGAAILGYAAAGSLPATKQPPDGRLSSMQH
jgi:hypothetical protein